MLKDVERAGNVHYSVFLSVLKSKLEDKPYISPFKLSFIELYAKCLYWNHFNFKRGGGGWLNACGYNCNQNFTGS